ncbi:hypothetical protein ACHWQZ_G015006 [Mnemiopsis leidyi]
MKFVFVLSTTLLTLLLNVAVGDRQYKALKFGNSVPDYIIYKPDMGPLQNAFSVCSWVKSLRTATSGAPSWFSYAVNGTTNEILISDDGGYNHIFDTGWNLGSHFSGLSGSGTWYHYCYTWSYSSLTQRVYLNGREIDSRSTSSDRRLGTGGYLVIGNDQNGSPGSGMASSFIFGGELYKLNFFSKELSSSGVLSGSIKWEDILQSGRTSSRDQEMVM